MNRTKIILRSNHEMHCYIMFLVFVAIWNQLCDIHFNFGYPSSGHCIFTWARMWSVFIFRSHKGSASKKVWETLYIVSNARIDMDAKKMDRRAHRWQRCMLYPEEGRIQSAAVFFRILWQICSTIRSCCGFHNSATLRKYSRYALGNPLHTQEDRCRDRVSG
jgi:hypothetical protein